MCGIVGYVGSGQAAPVLIEGLRRLEYRGYDSAGMSILDGGGRLATVKAPGKLRMLEAKLAETPLRGRCGIGHTRWATHGAPSTANAHPHTSADGTIAVVHNGIIENARRLRQDLEAAGTVFRSETDTEVIAHLIDRVWPEGGSSRTL